jgi:hypothetical protein
MAGAALAFRPAPAGVSLVGGFDLPPRLIARQETVEEPGGTRRTKIWEFSTNLHCSIVGTCLSTGELRQVLGKLGAAPAGATDHELHHNAVALAARHDLAAKLLHKALDHRHKLAINRFARAVDEAALAAMWRESVKNGEIPGAYWAVLTHSLTTPALVRQVFGEVHMLSHLVGAANRADIRRLAALEAENADLTERLRRQQDALHAAVLERDTRIDALQRALADRLTDDDHEPAAPADVEAGLRRAVGALQKRADAETRRRVAAESRGEAMRTALSSARAEAASGQQEAAALRAELAVLEAPFSAYGRADEPLPQPDEPLLDGMTLLYVGGRPNQVPGLRALAERCGAAELLHHDGGIEHATTLLPALVGRADLVLFPVDCVSHEAALAVKRSCRQGATRFVPLRSSGAGSFLAAIRDAGSMNGEAVMAASCAACAE